MKNLLTFTITIALFALAVAALTKPDDKTCIDRVTEHYTGSIAGSILNSFDAGAVVYEVHDHIIYKTVNNSVTGKQVAVCAYGQVWIN